MERELLTGFGFALGALALLGYAWWKFTEIEVPPFDDEDYEDWNGR